MSTRAKDETGLTYKERGYAEEFLRTGDMTGSYRKFYNVKPTRSSTDVYIDAKEALLRPHVQAYYHRRKQEIDCEIHRKTGISRKFIFDNLLEIVNNNRGKQAALKALELLGKEFGLFWEKPAAVLPSKLPSNDNVEAIKLVQTMLENGDITEASANNLIEFLKKKSSIEQEEYTNKEILEKIDFLMKKVSDEQTEDHQ